MAGFCVVYFALARYYRDGFSVNTWINGVYCTGKDVETVNRELLADTVLPETLIVYGKADENGNRAEWVLSLEELGVSVDYTANLESYLAEQDPFLWIDNITLHRKHTVSPEISYDEKALRSWCESTFPQEESSICELDCSAALGYSLSENLKDRMDTELIYETIGNSLKQMMTLQAEDSPPAVDLAAAGCYYDLEPTSEQEQTLTLWEKLEDYQTSGPVYDLGDGDWQVPAGEMAGLLVKEEMTDRPVTDAAGNLEVCEDTVTYFVEELAKEHDTYGKDWEFTDTAGETVTVAGGTYGTQIDQKTEAAWLEDYLTGQLGVTIVDEEGKTVRAAGETGQAGQESDAAAADSVSDGTARSPHIPSYTREAFCRSSTTLGDTYIEVDMGRQKLYYYQDGEMKIETDVVTGNMRLGRDTPEGVFYVYNKQKNRILRGANYATPVDYWMPVKGAVGIHDADWRSKFGGDIYLTNGSHGCINVPPEVMPELYEAVEIGTPVVMFYGAE